MVQDMLYHIVAILIQKKMVCVGQKLSQQTVRLGYCAIFQEPLDNATPVRMAGEFNILQYCQLYAKYLENIAF